MTPKLDWHVCSSRQEWLDLRRETVGASDDIEGRALDVWCSKKGLVDETMPEPGTPMYRGIVLEPLAIEEVEKDLRAGEGDFGAIVIPPPYTLIRCDPWPIHASPDALIGWMDGYNSHGVLQIKCPLYTGKEWELGPEALKEGGPLRRYWGQVQQEMFVCQADWGILAALLPDFSVRWTLIEPDMEYMKKRLLQCSQFMESVKSGVEPPAGTDDGDVLARMHPESVNEELRLGDEADLLLDLLTQARQPFQCPMCAGEGEHPLEGVGECPMCRGKCEIPYTQIERGEKGIRNRLKQLMGAHSRGVTPMGQVITVTDVPESVPGKPRKAYRKLNLPKEKTHA